MAAPSLFEFLKNINESGGDPDLLDREECLKAYSPFIVGRGVATSLSTILFANEANKAAFLDKELHYKYLFYSIKKQKRYDKWPKKQEVDPDIDVISQVYQVSIERAQEILGVLNAEQLESIRSSLDKGGEMKRGKSK